MSSKDRGNLFALLDSCTKIQKFVKDTVDADAFFGDDKTFDAVLMNFVVIGEAVSRLSTDVKKAHPHIPWVLIKDFRNLVAHDYFGVDAEEVWQIVQKNLPALAKDIGLILKNKN